MITHLAAAEAERIAALQRSIIFDTPEEEFDEIVFLATQLCAAPMAAIAFSGETGPYFKSHIGISDALIRQATSLCEQTILEPLARDRDSLSGTLRDTRDTAEPLAASETPLRFYVGVPLLTPDGYTVGCLSVMDLMPRELTAPQRDSLQILGRQVMRLLAKRHDSGISSREPWESQHFFQSTLDALTSHIAVLDQEGTIVAVNRIWQRFSEENGGSATSCGIGSNYIDSCAQASGLWSDEASLVAEGIRAVAAGEQQMFSVEYPCHSPGTERWFVVRVTRLDWDGPTRVVVAHENITERKRAEREVVFQARLLDTVGQAVIANDMDGVVLYWNRFAERLYGWTSAEAVGCNIASLVVPESGRSNVPGVLCQMAAGEGLSNEFIVKHRDGTHFLALVTSTPIYGEDGRVIGIIGISSDTTERKQMEEALRKSDEMFRQLSDNIADVFWIASPDFQEIRYVSPGYERIWGCTCGSLYDDPHQWIEAILVEDRERVIAEFTRLRMNAYTVSVEYRIMRPDGTIRWLHDRGFQVRNAADAVIGITGIVTDITERKQAEAALRASEERFRTTLENLMEGCQIIAHDWRYLYANAGAGRHGKRPVQELLGRTMMEAFPGIEATEMFAVLQQCMTERISRRIENEFVYGDGTSAWFELAIEPVPEGVFVLSLDITERKRAEDELRWKSAFLEAQVQSSIDGILVVNSEGKKILKNQRMADLFKIPPHIRDDADDSLTLRWVTSMTRDPERFIERVAYLYAHQNEIGMDEIELKDGTILERYSSPVLSKEGVYYGRIWTFHEITKRKRAERENLRLAAIVESTDDAVISMTIDEGTITSWNQGASRLYGYTAEEVIGRPISVLIPSGKYNGESAVLEKIRRGEYVDHFETTRQRKDRTLVDVSLTISPLKDPEGRIIGASKIARDVTERKQAELALKQARDELENRVTERTTDLVMAIEDADRANRAKSEFLSRMSHELRTPLNAILGFGQILNKQELTPLQKESVQYILKGGRHLLDLINEVLDIARVEAGRMELSVEPIALEDIVPEACALVRPLATERQVRLEVDLSTLSAMHVLADRQRLKQVLINLLSNGIKYNHPGGRVDVYCYLLEGANEKIRIAVRDTGPGIPADLLPKLFTPFERLGAANSDVEGTGLGLALSQRLVTAMGGTLQVESVVGEGSRFMVELPCAPALADAHEGLRISSDEQVATVSERHTYTILSIEDNVSNVHLLEAILSSRPEITLLAAMQGSVGLDLARQHLPDLILLDLHLPDIAGWDVLTRLQQSTVTRDIPVIVISADATSSQRERLLNDGARAYLTKPLGIDQFLRTIDEILQTDDTTASDKE